MSSRPASPPRAPRARARALLAVAVVAAGLGVLAERANLLRPLELSSIDARFRLRGTQAPHARVAVVAIDEQSLADLGEPWPIRRSHHAAMLDALRRAGARTIVYDVQFTEPSTRPGDDDRLIEAVQRTPHVVLATSEVTTKGKTLVFGGIAERLGARVGHGEIVDDPDGVLRRLSYAVAGLPTLAVVATEVATGHRVARSAFQGTTPLIDYAGPPGTVPTY